MRRRPLLLVKIFGPENVGSAPYFEILAMPLIPNAKKIAALGKSRVHATELQENAKFQLENYTSARGGGCGSSDAD